MTSPEHVCEQDARVGELVAVACPDHSMIWLSPGDAEGYFKAMCAALKVQFFVAASLIFILMWTTT